MSKKTDMQLKFCKIDKYHRDGYKGKGITIFNHELDKKGEHGEMTTDVLQLVSPEANIINGSLSSIVSSSNPSSNHFYFIMANGEKLSPMEMYEKYHPDIVSVSFSGQSQYYLDQMKPLVDKGCILFCSAGNEGSSGVTGKYEGLGLLCGSAVVYDDGSVKMASYSGYDKDKISVDFTGFMGDGSGTSAGCPFVAGQCALILQKYGKMSQDEFVKFASEFTYDVYNDGIDVKSGRGIIIMPNVDNVEFDDVADDAWYHDAVEFCAQRGYMNGVGNNEFDPEMLLTRAELAQVVYNIFKDK